MAQRFPDLLIKGSKKASPMIVFAHGTGAGMDTPFIFRVSVLVGCVQFAGLFLDHALDLAAGDEDGGHFHAELGGGLGSRSRIVPR
jgi:hypothetical protein